MNIASGFIDGSALYGATERDFQAIRSYKDGQVDINVCRRCREKGAVGALHTLLLQEHNRIAQELARFNPSWADTTLFLEARRALTAQIQHITYNEFLPVVLGREITNKDELHLVAGKHYSGYSSTNRGGVYNEFAVGALPAFMSMLPAGMMNDSVSAEILIGTPGLIKTYIPTREAKNEWSEIALAIQRGRDHGLPAYHKALNLCQPRLQSVEGVKVTFEDLQKAGLTEEAVEDLKKIYM